MPANNSDSWYSFGGSSIIDKVITSIFGSKAPSRKTRKKSRRPSKQVRSKRSDDNSSSGVAKKMTKQTRKLVVAIQENVLPLLEADSRAFDEDLISKNRLLFALNRAAERALKRKDVFGHLEQLKAEADEAEEVVAEFLDKEIGKDSSKGQISLMAAKCALCGAPCVKCVSFEFFWSI